MRCRMPLPRAPDPVWDERDPYPCRVRRPGGCGSYAPEGRLDFPAPTSKQARAWTVGRLQGAAMSTIDDQRFVREVDAAGPTVREVHQAVRVARVRHCRHGRARAVRRGRVRRRPVSQYRPSVLVDTTTQSRVVRSDFPRERRLVRAVVAAAVALSVLYIGFIRVFEPDTNQRFLVIGVYVIAAVAAVC